MSFARGCVVALVVLQTMIIACAAHSTSTDLALKTKSFDKWGLVWVGETYDVDRDGTDEELVSAYEGHSPAVTHPRTGEVIIPEIFDYGIAYGSCEIPEGSSACPVPLSIVIRGPCFPIPLADVAKKDKVKVRGVDGYVKQDGGIYVQTEDFTVIIDATAPNEEQATKRALKVAEDLVGANEKAKHITKDTDFKVKSNDACPPSALATPST